jgi:hypothetical protein
MRFSDGKIVAEDKQADAGEIGRPGEMYRRIRIALGFGNILVMVTGGHLSYPLGYEATGYEVRDLGETLEKARVAGAKVLSAPSKTGDRASAIVGFPGGYIRGVHSVVAR